MRGGAPTSRYPFGSPRPVLYGEYPYYRALPRRWSGNLRALAESGIDVVTCYVPWRFHEIAPREYDFTGATNPQRDIVGLLRLVQEAGLRAVVKPGPFIHGEVQLGGLPDRVSPSLSRQDAGVLDVRGAPATSQGMILPTLYDPEYRAEVRDWLSAVDWYVLAPALAPRGPVVGVQLGNEGIYSDANQPATAHDFSPWAIHAFTDHLRTADKDLADVAANRQPDTWPPELRAAWAGWSGHVLCDHYRSLAADLSPAVRGIAMVNIPLPLLDGPPGAAQTWLLRTARLANTGMTECYTNWVGNAARSSDAFAAHWFGARTRRTSNVEDNWGFTWTDPTYARPQTPLFHALLALALGSESCSVYTACVTGDWGTEIDLDPDGLRSEGREPLDYAPPYCPGAPVREDGTANANMAALLTLRDLLHEYGPALARGAYAADALVFASAAMATATAWPDEVDDDVETGVLARTVRLAAELMNRHQFRIDVITESTAPDADADPNIPWLVPLATAQRDDGLLALLQARRRVGGAVLLLSAKPLAGAWAEWAGPAPVAPEADAVLPLLPSPRYAHPRSDPGTVLIHEDAQGRPTALFAFNPGAVPAAVRRSLAGIEATVDLAPGGCACLIADRSGFPVVLIVPGPETTWTTGSNDVPTHAKGEISACDEIR